MIVIFLPGFLCLASDLNLWRDLLPAEVRTMDLPGQAGTAPIADQTVAGLVDHFAAIIPREAFVVGESLGGLIALGLAGRGHRAAAFDPPLATAKSWQLHRGIPSSVAARPYRPWLPDFVANIFGAMPDGSIEERNYWPLLDALDAPAHIFAASEPLWPIRESDTVHSVLDEVDE